MKKIKMLILGLLLAAQTGVVSAQNTIINGHKFIDLALPSGVLWADSNIGANSEADPGDYYGWGETLPKNAYSWAGYSHGMDEDHITKYNQRDNKLGLDVADDAAYANWSCCRIPTNNEFAELRDTTNCKWTWTERYTPTGDVVDGYLVTSKVNGNSIFLPAGGCRDGEGTDYYGARGFYWTSTLSSLYSNYAYFQCIESEGPYSSYDHRYYGLSIRPVTDAMTGLATR